MPKFDCVISNPPYQAVTKTTGVSGNTQGGLWFKFLKDISYEIIKDDGIVAFISPYFGGIGNLGKKNFKFDWFRESGLMYINFNAGKYFKVNSTVNYYIIKKDYLNKINIEIEDNSFSVDMSNIIALPFLCNEKNISILNKILIKDDKFNFKEGFDLNIGDIKICILSSRYQKWDNIFIDKTGYTDKKYKVSYPIPNEEILGWESYLKLKLPKLYFKMVGGELGQSPTNILKNLPYLDMTKVWTDQALYSHFGLTKEEIDYIENNVK